jgi:probable HAF family extracellular repeat protein
MHGSSTRALAHASGKSDRARRIGNALAELLLVGACSMASQALAAHTYAFTIYDSLGGDVSYARAINNVGQIAGSSTLPANAQLHATLWTAGVPADLGMLGGSYSEGHALNDMGDAVGMSSIAPNSDYNATLWKGSGIQDLGTVGSLTVARGINNAGTIVGSGFCNCNSGYLVPLLFGSTGPSLLDTGLFGNGEALGINNSGQIVGYRVSLSTNQYEPVVWDGATVMPLGVPDGLPLAYPTAVSDTGQIAGTASTSSGAPHAVKWIAGMPIVLDSSASFQSMARGVNNAGQVVGLRAPLAGNFLETQRAMRPSVRCCGTPTAQPT